MPTNVEKVASKIMGTAKKAKGTLEGLSPVFKTLMEEHGQVSALLLRLKASSDLETRRRLWPTIRKELLSHEKAEVAVVYPMFKQDAETSQLAVEHDEEADQLSSQIGRLEELDLADPAWDPLFQQLVELVTHHVHEEESSIFPAGQRRLGRQLEGLEATYLEKKNSIIAQL